MSRTETIKAGWLAALATCFMFCELSIVNARYFRNDGPLPWAVAFDMLCTLPAAYAWFVLRPAARPLLELAPLLGCSIVGTGFLLRHVNAVQLPLHVFAAAIELSVLALFVRRVTGALRHGSDAQHDLVLRIQKQPELWLRVVGFELCVLFYAFGPKPVSPSAGVQTFDNHGPAQRFLLGLAVLSVMEAVPLHFLLHAWKPLLAWIVLALTLYSLCWIVGMYRALAARPHLLSEDRLSVRVGLFYSVEIERSAIMHTQSYESPQPDVVALKLIAPPNVLIELSAPARVYGPFGRTQAATRLAFYTERSDELARLQSHPRCDPQQQK